MENKIDWETTPESSQATSGLRGITRRQMVRRLAAAVASGAALPGVAVAQPVHKHLASSATMERAEEKAADPEWTPVFFDAHQNETFTVLAERIVPGATEAKVNRFVDLLLSVDTLPAQKSFVDSLSAFDAYSIQHYNRPFKDLTEDQQNEVLTVASTAAPGHEAPRRRFGLGPAPKPGNEEVKHTFRDHFENMKHWVSGAYYSSEIGMKEMGWTGQVMWPEFPGCQHPEGHH